MSKAGLKIVNGLLSVFIVLLVGGCSAKLNEEKRGEMSWAYDVCQANGGLKEIKVSTAIAPKAYCLNGAVFTKIDQTAN